LEGQLRDTLSSLLLLRKAKLELTRPMEAARKHAESKHLNWEELNPDEKPLCPPLLIIGNDSGLSGQGLSALSWLLISGLPIKILILADLAVGLEANGITATPAISTRNPKLNMGLFAMAQRQAYVAQTAISDPDHFMESFKAALNFTGPALIHVHTPSPERHGFATSKTLEHARKAVESRAFPLFRYDPQREGVFGSRIDLAGNPDLDKPWVGDPPFTPADWSLTERRFRTHFVPLSEQDPAPLALADYLKIEVRDQSGKTPYVEAEDDEDEPLRYRVDTALTEVAKERLHGWRTLQELAGRVTPFTHQVETMARQAIAQAHQAELEALKREYEARIDDLEAEIAVRLQRRLMNLAGYQAVDH
jgi:pyruvate-ferredoxin/flavodoxin oxidoreductase